MKTILVIDNDQSITDFFKEFLSEQRFVVFIANTTDDAFKIVENEKLDLIFLDINMSMMGGVFISDTIARFRMSNNSRIIIMSGSGFDSFLIEVLNNKSADGYFLKPSNINELRGRLKEVINVPEA